MVGIDFGTTNSAIAALDTQGAVQMVEYHAAGRAVSTYRSLLYLEQRKTAGRLQIHSWSGPEGIGRYLEADPRGRLIQSLKSYLSSRTLTGTEIFGRTQQLEDLVARILRDLRMQAEQWLGRPVREALVGRPVRFVGANSAADDDHALDRLRQAFHRAGFERIEFELEPVAAAAHYASGLERPETVLIGDFGGGTSDFSLLRLRPPGSRTERQVELLAAAGVGLAGDAFDARLVRHLVSPRLGAGSLERSGGKTLVAVPAWIYARLEHWHHLSFLRTRGVSEILRAARTRAIEPEPIAALSELIEADLGYQLHQAVQRTKIALSSREETEFHLDEHGIRLHAPVTRSQFEDWIAPDLRLIEEAVARAMTASGLSETAVDRVFLTGGTSQVPAVRRIFTRRFGSERVLSGDEFTSVARGLALRAGPNSGRATGRATG